MTVIEKQKSDLIGWLSIQNNPDLIEKFYVLMQEEMDEISQENLEILDKRLKEHKINPEDSIPWRESIAKIKDKHGI